MRQINVYKKLPKSMKNIKINRLFLLFFCLAFLFISCRSDEEKALREKLTSISIPDNIINTTLTPVVINEYRQAELAINRRYIKEIKSIITDDFDEKVDVFEEKELGFFRSYKHMFKVLVEDKNELKDYWNLKTSKYFSDLTTLQNLHDCYLSYNNDIQKLRNQISNSPKCSCIPQEIRYNIKSQDVSLAKMSQHSYLNLAIEFGTDIAVWLLIMGIISIISLFIGCVAPPTWVLTIITIIASIILSIWNDKHMIDSIKDQYQYQLELDNSDILKELDKYTYEFYDYISE